MDEEGNMKEDLEVPGEDTEIGARIRENLESSPIVTVTCAMGMEIITDVSVPQE